MTSLESPGLSHGEVQHPLHGVAQVFVHPQRRFNLRRRQPFGMVI